MAQVQGPDGKLYDVIEVTGDSAPDGYSIQQGPNGKRIAVKPLSSSGDSFKDYAIKQGSKYGIKYGAKKLAESQGTDTAQAGQLASGAINLYDAYDKYQKGDKGGAAVSGVSGGVNVAAGLGNEAAKGAVPYLAVAKGAYDVGKVFGNKNLTDKQKATEARQQAENTAASYYTFGLSSLAQMADAKLLGGKGEKFRDKNEKYLTGGQSVINDKIVEKGLGFFGGPSTKEIQKKRDNALVKNNVTGFKDYLAQRKPGLNAEGKQAAGFAGDYVGDTEKGYINNKFAQSRDEKDLGVKDVVGGNQNFELVGNDYLGKWSEAQRNKFNQLNLEAGNIRESKGGLSFVDSAKAKAFVDQVAKEGGGKQMSEPLQIQGPTNLSTKGINVRSSNPVGMSTPRSGVDTRADRLNLLSKVAESQKKKLGAFSKLYE